MFSPSQKASIGKFEGRQEATYKMARAGNSLFAYVIEGAFEGQHRLLEQGDGLALWGIEKVALEALSNNAVILLVGVVLPVL